METIEDFQKKNAESETRKIEPWAEAAVKSGKATEKELEVYGYISDQHAMVAAKLQGDADRRETADQAFLRHIYTEASKKFGVSERAARLIYLRLNVLHVNYRPPSNIDFSPEAIDRNMPKYIEYYRDHRNQLIISAALCRKHGVSHRPEPFLVGCAALTLDPDLQDGEYAVNQAHNCTPVKGVYKGCEKRCAERNAIGGAIHHDTRLVIAVVIVSKEKDTGDGSKSCGALHPCLECRKMYRDLLQKGLLREDSIICSANDAELDERGMPSVIEEMNVKELLELYKDDPED